MSRFRKQLLFLCDALLFAVAVAGYKFITVLLPYTEVGAKGSFPKNVLLLYGCTVIAQLLFKTYDSLWRYAESREYLVLMCAAVCGFGAYEIFSRALLHETISFVLLAAIASLWVLEMLAVRFGYRMYRTFSIQRDQPGAIPVAIIGAGSAGVQLLDELQHNSNSRYHVQCFFDDDPAKVNKRIRGVPISGFISQALPRMRAMDIHEAIFAIPSMDDLHRKEILRQLADRSIKVSTLPSMLELIDQKPEDDNGRVTLVNASEAADGTLTESAVRTGVWAWKCPQENGEAKLVKLCGDVRFFDVDFAYDPEKPVLHDITLYAKPGQKLAFVGATGAGKTTITNLINRFYDLADGKIRYDGININHIKKADLRHSLGIVLQDVNLFTGTVMDNIRYGKLDATDEECIAAAKLANAHDFITRLPDGYNTMLTANGANLSQGQRQLLSIARAAVADPPVMILDEATSSIDTRTELLVQRGMDALMKGRTVFVIAHRLSTVQNSDAIMVLDHGRIIERGTHDDLIAQKGTYYQLYTGAFELE